MRAAAERGLLSRAASIFNGWWVPAAVVFLAVVPSVYAAWSYRTGADRDEAAAAGEAFKLRGPIRDSSAGAGGSASIDRELSLKNAVSERLQLTLQLTIAGSLRLAAERANGRVPADAAELYKGMKRGGLVPGVLSPPLQSSRPDAVVLGYDGGSFVLRYVPGNFMVEVVSFGAYGGEPDPPMLIRNPGDGDRPDLPSFYKRTAAVTLGGAAGPRAPAELQAPAAFEDAVSLVADGWRLSELPYDVLNKVGVSR